MTLTLRRTKIRQAPVYEGVGDFTVYDDGKPVGRLYERHTAARAPIWHWSITAYVEPRAGLNTSGTAETLDAAKTAFDDAWDKSKAWGGQSGFDSQAG
jgi:hypothetical protein